MGRLYRASALTAQAVVIAVVLTCAAATIVAFASPREHRRLMHKGVVVDLLATPMSSGAD